MWAGSWAVGLVVGAIVLSLVTFGFVIGAPIFSIPIVIVGIALLGVLDMQRRRKQSEELQTFRERAKTERVEFTSRDQETLVSE